MPLQSNDSVLIPVFILHWNRPDECLATVQSFLAQDISLKITIIDNCSSKENAQKLKSSLPSNVDFVQLSENKGWGGAFNILLRQWLKEGESDYCIISSHDPLLSTNCLKMLLEAITKDKEIGIISPESGTRHLPKFSPILGPHLIDNIPARPFGTVEIVDFVHGTVTMFRKECLSEIGLFNERFFVYGDEYDICLRANKYGWKCAVVWGSIVSNPTTAAPKAVINYLLSRNTLELARVHGSLIQSLCRAVLMLVNSSLIWLRSKSEEKSLISAKFLGIRDFLLNRYGKSKAFNQLIS